MAQPRILHKDDPSKAPLVGNVKVTRDDWLNVAFEALVADGVETVKILTLADRLGVSRSSFYWYFNSRQDILDALLERWHRTNTAALVAHAEMPAGTITAACCNVFRCFLIPNTFDNALDFAIRDWARRSTAVRQSLEQSDALRISALEAMFQRFGYEETEALVRARTLYYMQIGYNDADLHEPMEARLRLVAHYVQVFTGIDADRDDIEQLRADVVRGADAVARAGETREREG